MLRSQKFLHFLLVAVLFSFSLSAQELLKASDINRVMQQIFSQHVAKKNISGAILKSSFEIYIDQFDPFRTYLLAEEVAPFLQISESEMNQIMNQYRQQNFSAFAKLNSVIQKAIERQRLYRKEITANKEDLFKIQASETDSSRIPYDEPDLKVPFAKTTEELKKRVKQRIIHFIFEEKRHFGDEAVMRNQDRTLQIYESHMIEHENSYLFANDAGAPLTPAQQENLFVIHILKALAGSLDAHTTFYDNTEAYDLKVRLEKGFEGIGVVLQQSADGMIVITHLVKGGPAARSGKIQEQDRLVSIDGKPLAGLPFQKITDLIRGENGSTIDLILQRKEKGQESPRNIDVTLKREPITVDEDRVEIKSEPFANGIIGTITLHSFYQGANGVTSENDVRNAIKELSKKGPLKGLILDLRENSGGFLTQAVKVAGLFIKSGIIVISKYSDGHEQFYRDMTSDAVYAGPLVVLTSKATASAAEIVAQALQDYGVALVVGDEHTYGKGSIQSQTVTDNQATSYFKVTVGKYYTVSGKTPQIKGVQADIEAPGPYDYEHIGEQYLENALPNDSIKPEYKDDLSDIDPGLKSWYLRYYLPSLQPKISIWRNLLPILKSKSAERIAKNGEYQASMSRWKAEEQETPVDNNSKNKPNDYQLGEASNILKDMIILHAQERQPTDSSTGKFFSGPGE